MVESIYFRSISNSNSKKPKTEENPSESSEEDDDEEEGGNGDLSKYDLWGSDDDTNANKEKNSNEKTMKQDERKRSTSKRRSRSRWIDFILISNWNKLKNFHTFWSDQDRIRRAVAAVQVAVETKSTEEESTADRGHQDHHPNPVILVHDPVHVLIFDLEVVHVHVQVIEIVENDKNITM